MPVAVVRESMEPAQAGPGGPGMHLLWTVDAHNRQPWPSRENRPAILPVSSQYTRLTDDVKMNCTPGACLPTVMAGGR